MVAAVHGRDAAFQNRNEKAHDIAAPLCADKAGLDQRVRETLEAAEVCD